MANEQHRSIIEALRVEDDFYNKLEKLNVQAGKSHKTLLAHVQRICEAHDTVL